MSIYPCVIKQDFETYDGLQLIARGQASNVHNSFVGELTWKFESGIVKFFQLTAVMYFDDLLGNKDNYPYPWNVDDWGLYEVIGSSYLDRLANEEDVTGRFYFSSKHYVYFDKNFLWHIICKNIEVVSLPVNNSSAG